MALVWISDWWSGKVDRDDEHTVLFRGLDDRVYCNSIRLGEATGEYWRPIIQGQPIIYHGELPPESPEAIAIDREYEEKHRNAQMDQGLDRRHDDPGDDQPHDGTQRPDEPDERLRRENGDGDGLRGDE